jgi:hypothetical protein
MESIIIIVTIVTLGFIAFLWQVLYSKDDVDLKVNLKKFEMNLRKRKRGP